MRRGSRGTLSQCEANNEWGSQSHYNHEVGGRERSESPAINHEVAGDMHSQNGVGGGGRELLTLSTLRSHHFQVVS